MNVQTFRPDWVLAICLAGICGCGEEPVDTSGSVPLVPAGSDLPTDSDSQSAPATPAAGWKKIVGISFDIPETWEERPMTEMQRSIYGAKYGLPEYGKDLELTFSEVGGGIEANFKRWEGQFAGGKLRKEKISVKGKTVELIEVDGVFRAFGDEQLDWGLIGAAVPGTGGDDVYLKLTGPRQDVADAREEVIAFIKSMRP